ncbi:MAG: aminodeoxychorismate/anthranilate synthase component II [Myxococcota bacterium]|nr:aminodeoxychorismate/anthranilate synthase component II [Myxococcota bacterium]
MSVPVLVLDNYDSFTWNLVQLLGQLGAEAAVVRNDAAPLAALLARRPAGVVVSPGPGAPESAGVSVAAVAAFARAGVPVWGVCLGHQAIAAAFGGRVRRAPRLRHGRTAAIEHGGAGLLVGLPSPFEATVYHSLVVDEARWPAALEVTARGPDGEVMALRHRTLPAEGVQFHPESVLSEHGAAIAARFLARCRSRAAA